MSIQRVNPEGLFSLDAFTQIVTVEAGTRLAHVAGQGAFDADFRLIGQDDLHAQTVQAFRNLRVAVESVGGRVEDVVSMTIYLVDIEAKKVDVFTKAMGECLDGEAFPPNASTMVGVTGLAAPGMLIEISAVAAIGG